MRYKSNVIKGFGRGRTIGYPTFNLEIPKDFNFEYGAYAAWVWVDGARYRGAMHYGPIPTFGLARPSLEIFLLNYTKNEPMAQLEFEVVRFIRDIIKFSNSQELKQQIKTDIQSIERILSMD